jgi:hypothetical protein
MSRKVFEYKVTFDTAQWGHEGGEELEEADATKAKKIMFEHMCYMLNDIALDHPACEDFSNIKLVKFEEFEDE